MKTFVGLSFAIILFSIIIQNVFGDEDEKCSKTNGNRLIDQDFGMALTPDDFMTSMMSPWIFRDYFRPWRHLEALSRNFVSTINSDKDKFQIILDVQHFAPEEITVKTTDDYVLIEGKHEEKKDQHGFVSRQFSRRYAMPAGTEPQSILSHLSSDGILTITAPRKPAEENSERIVPITQTGPVRKESKEKEDTCQKEKCDNP